MFEYDNVYDDMQGKKAEQAKAKSRTVDKKVSFQKFPKELSYPSDLNKCPEGIAIETSK